MNSECLTRAVMYRGGVNGRVIWINCSWKWDFSNFLAELPKGFAIIS
jgi:hypothetical protein